MELLLGYVPETLSLKEADMLWITIDQGRKNMKVNKYIFLLRSLPSNNATYVFSDNPGYSVELVFNMMRVVKGYTAQYMIFNGTEYTCLDSAVVTKIHDLELFLNKYLKNSYKHISKEDFYEEINRIDKNVARNLTTVFIDHQSRF